MWTVNYNGPRGITVTDPVTGKWQAYNQCEAYHPGTWFIRYSDAPEDRYIAVKESSEP